MALNSKTLNFLIRELQKASSEGFISIASQIFGYLKEEIKDNPMYIKYENESVKWEEWLNKEARVNLILPSTFEESKDLSYAVYRKVGSMDNSKAFDFIFSLFGENNIERNYNEFNKTFLNYFTEALNDILIANPELQNETPEKALGTTVFIIHGHDELMKTQVQLLMHIAGVRSYVLHEVADKGRHTLDKLIEETKDAAYAIALLSPDDLIIDGKGRARQNVILEIGYFIGQLGKPRVRMIIKEDVEVPSDLDGILYQRFDKDGAWKVKLIKELQAVGIFVDMKAVFDNI